MSQPVSIRLSDDTVERLAERARRRQIPTRTLAQRYVEEGLRMEEHPLVRFVDGPAGRRARLVGSGLDVWEVVAVVKDNRGDVACTREYLGLPQGLVQAAVSYYGAFAAEVDEWIEINARESEEALQAWLTGRAAMEA